MTSKEQSIFHPLPNQTVVLTLAFIGGFVDAVGYIKLDGLFTSSITGNLVVASTAFFTDAGGVFARFFVSLAFAFGAFLTTLTSVRSRQFLKVNNYDLGMNLFGWEVIFLLATMAVGLSIEYTHNTFTGLESWQAILTGSVMAMSMGVHNAAAQELITNCPSTTVMTMTIVKTSMYAANAFQYLLATQALSVLYAKHEDKPHDYDAILLDHYNKHVAKFVEFGMHLCTFVAGAIIGAVIATHASYWAIFVPSALVFGLMGCICYNKAARSTNSASNAVSTVPAVPKVDVEMAVKCDICEIEDSEQASSLELIR